MRTVIRLQNHGCRNHPFWWITVQGSYTNPKGRFIEHVGYYLPRRTATVQRAVIFNKPRILYWLAMGAQPSGNVQKFLSYIDMMPKPRPSFSSRQVYEKQPKDYGKPDYPEFLPKGTMTDIHYEKFKETVELNLLERELNTQHEINKQAKLNEEEVDPELVESDNENPVERTQTFHKLRNQFVKFEKDIKKLNTRKREMLFRKMNKLSSKGLVDLEQIKKNREAEINAEDSNTTGDYGTTAKERIEKELKLKKLNDRKKKQLENAVFMKELLQPMSPDDYRNYIIQHGIVSPHKAQKETEELFAAHKHHNLKVLKWDAYVQTQTEALQAQNITDGRQLLHKDKSDFHPAIAPITPFPDMWNFDPKDYYDTKLGPTEIDNPNKAYVSSRTPPVVEKQTKMVYRKKHNKGRKTHVRIHFSTFNGASDRISFASSSNMTTAYTGV